MTQQSASVELDKPTISLFVIEVNPSIAERIVSHADREVICVHSLGEARNIGGILAVPTMDVIINGVIGGSSHATLDFIRKLTTVGFRNVYVTSAYGGFLEQMAKIPGTIRVEFEYYPDKLSEVL